MLSNAYFLAKFRFDTAENEPAKNLQNLNFAKFANFADPNPLTPRDLESGPPGAPCLQSELTGGVLMTSGPYIAKTKISKKRAIW